MATPESIDTDLRGVLVQQLSAVSSLLLDVRRHLLASPAGDACVAAVEKAGAFSDEVIEMLGSQPVVGGCEDWAHLRRQD